jgi:hypothetical protein
MKIMLTLVTVILFAGCAPPSVNLQLSAIRSAGDISATTYLDERDLPNVPARIKEIGTFGRKVAEFLGTGNAAGLAETKLKSAVLKLVPAAYQPIADSLIDSMAKRKLNVDVDKIGKANVARIRAFFLGVVTASERYRMDLRKAEEEKLAREAAEAEATESPPAEEPSPEPTPADPPATAPTDV